MSRNTIQRGLVMQAVQSMHNHPTADEIYSHIVRSHPGISRATVYRNLAALAGEGLIQRVTHLDAADRFDFNLAPHYHFICQGCGKVYDVELPYQDKLLEAIQPLPGFTYQQHHLTVTGLCPHCGSQQGN